MHSFVLFAGILPLVAAEACSSVVAKTHLVTSVITTIEYTTLPSEPECTTLSQAVPVESPSGDVPGPQESEWVPPPRPSGTDFEWLPTLQPSSEELIIITTSLSPAKPSSSSEEGLKPVTTSQPEVSETSIKGQSSSTADIPEPTESAPSPNTSAATSDSPIPSSVLVRTSSTVCAGESCTPISESSVTPVPTSDSEKPASSSSSSEPCTTSSASSDSPKPSASESSGTPVPTTVSESSGTPIPTTASETSDSPVPTSVSETSDSPAPSSASEKTSATASESEPCTTSSGSSPSSTDATASAKTSATASESEPCTTSSASSPSSTDATASAKTSETASESESCTTSSVAATTSVETSAAASESTSCTTSSTAVESTSCTTSSTAAESTSCTTSSTAAESTSCTTSSTATESTSCTTSSTATTAKQSSDAPTSVKTSAPSAPATSSVKTSASSTFSSAVSTLSTLTKPATTSKAPASTSSQVPTTTSSEAPKETKLRRAYPADIVDELQDESMDKLKEWLSKNKANGCTLEKATVRREWGDLSLEQREDYVGAVVCLQSKPALYSGQVAGAKSRFDDFIVAHQAQTNYIHGTANFLTWHRYFLHAFEKALKNECGYKGVMPYWNWDRYADDLENSPLFNGDSGSLGGNSGRSGCVETGPFKSYTVNIGPGASTRYNPRCLVRNLSKTAARYTKVDISYPLITQSNSVATFQDRLQSNNNVHASGHHTVGGNPGADIFTSPGDPYFHLHHAGVDRLYWIWQLQDLNSRLSQVAGQNGQTRRAGSLTERMNLGLNAGDVELGSLLNTMGGLGGELCYIYY